MSRIDPLPLLTNWPLFEPLRQFELGCVTQNATDLPEVAVRQALGRSNAGWWECELPANSLTWTTGVYDIFGLPRSVPISRDEAVGLYSESSRAAMERLRSYSIAQGCGFVLDAEIRPADGAPPRWMRLLGAPLRHAGEIVGLHGLKLML